MGRSINKLRSKKGFTLIELIVVLAVLAIIMAIAVPRFVGVQEEAKVESDRATLANIVKISEFYLVKGEMVKGVVGTPQEYTSETTPSLESIIGEDFPAIEFQSEGNEDAVLADVTVSIDADGVVSASVGADTALVKYPE